MAYVPQAEHIALRSVRGHRDEIDFLRVITADAIRHPNAPAQTQEERMKAIDNAGKLVADWGEVEHDTGFIAVLNAGAGKRHGELLGGGFFRYTDAPYLADHPDLQHAPEVVLGVRQIRRGRGVGGILLRRLAEAADEQRIPALRLRVYGNNVPARRLCTQQGFVTRDTLRAPAADDTLELMVRTAS